MHYNQMSRNFLGTHIDAVYHTSLCFGGIEYFFGAGVQTCYPGSSHHGRPMEVISMGRTQLDMEVILEYLESLKTIYTAEVGSLAAFDKRHTAHSASSPTTFSSITATTSAMTLLYFSSAKGYPITLPHYHRLF